MHDIKLIRKDSDFFSKKLLDRHSGIDLKYLLDLDKKNRVLIQNKEKLEQEKKIISQKQDKSLFKRSKEMSFEIDNLSKNQIKIRDEIDVLKHKKVNFFKILALSTDRIAD